MPGESINANLITDNCGYALRTALQKIEVTSGKSAKTDHETQLNEYVHLPSLRYYRIVSQYELLVQLYSRDDRGWRLDTFSEPAAAVALPDLGGSLKVSEVYENVTGL